MQKNSCYVLIIFITGFLITIIFGFNTKADSSGSVISTVKISICGNDIRETGEHCDESDLGEKSCADLGFSGGTLSCSAPCQFNTSSCASVAEATAEPSFTISTGGTYTLTNENNSAKITLPENFYTQDLQLQMFSYDNSVFESSKPAPSGKSFIGKTYDFVFVDSDGNTVSTISQQATLVLAYTAVDIIGISESTLAPYHYSGSSWELISGATVDTANKTVTFTATAFSSFALFGSAAQQQPSVVGGSGIIFISKILSPYFLPPILFLPKNADLNNDGNIDIVDLSILLYYLDKPLQVSEKYDFNKDGKIDIVDISILLFYWTE